MHDTPLMVELSIGCACASFILGVAGAYLRVTDGDRAATYGCLAAANWLVAACVALASLFGLLAMHGSIAVVCTWLWWRNRRRGRGKKALKQVGAKSRALVLALVDRMTRSPIPSPAGGGANSLLAEERAKEVTSA